MRFRLGANPSAGGGVLPGYAPGRDIVHAILSPGESVLTPEATRAVGPSNIMALNAAASGRPPGGAGPQHFSGGGVVGYNPRVTAGFDRGIKALFGSPLAIAQAAEQGQEAEAKRVLMGAQTRQADAHTALFQQKADEGREQMQRGSVPELITTASLMNGVPLHQVPEVSNYVQTGSLPGQYVRPPDDLGGGPALPKPDYANSDGLGGKIMRSLGLLRGGLTAGGNIEQITKAGGELQDQDVLAQALALAKQGDDMGMSRLNAIRGKKEFSPFKAVGNTGTTVNEITGQQSVSLPGMYDLFGQGEQAQIAQRRAAAGASAASAEHSRAGTAKIREETTQLRSGQGRIPPGYRMAPDGVSMEAIPGGPAALGKALPTKLASDLGEQAGIADSTQRFVTTFQPEYAGKTILGDVSNVAGRVFGDDTGQSQWWQDYAMHEATIRNKLFGASLTPGEQAQWMKLTVTPRMNADQVKQNLDRRAQIEQLGLNRMMAGAAAGGYNRDQIEAVTGRPVPGANAGAAVTPAASAGPLKLSAKPGEAEVQYGRLPSGAEFIAPDGSRRRKP